MFSQVESGIPKDDSKDLELHKIYEIYNLRKSYAIDIHWFR